MLLNAPHNDWAGKDLMLAIKKQQPEAVFFGIGGRDMEKAGLHGLPGLPHRVNFLALKNICTRRSLMRDLTEQCREKNIDTVITIGPAPVFTPLVRRLTKKLRLVCFHYGNIHKLKQSLSGSGWLLRRGLYKNLRHYKKIFCFFPFLRDHLEAEGITTQFVSHPMLAHFAELIPTGEAKPLNAPRRVALLPGRQGATIRAYMPVMARSLYALREKAGDAEVVLPLANATNPRFLEPYANLEAQYARGAEKHKALSGCDAALAVAGESNLTLAVFGVPMVAVYKTPATGLWQKLKPQPEGYKSPINILLGKEAVPEVPARDLATITGKTKDLLENTPARKAQLAAFKEVRAALRSSEGKSASSIAAAAFVAALGR